jgi:hypothetical protein
VDDHGFPVGYLMRQKQVMGIKTGDRVRAVVPEGFAAHGTHTGRNAVRVNKQFRMGRVQGIPARFCRVLQFADGYDYALVDTGSEHVAVASHIEKQSKRGSLSPGSAAVHFLETNFPYADTLRRKSLGKSL